MVSQGRGCNTAGRPCSKWNPLSDLPKLNLANTELSLFSFLRPVSQPMVSTVGTEISRDSKKELGEVLVSPLRSSRATTSPSEELDIWCIMKGKGNYMVTVYSSWELPPL